MFGSLFCKTLIVKSILLFLFLGNFKLILFDKVSKKGNNSSFLANEVFTNFNFTYKYLNLVFLFMTTFQFLFFQDLSKGGCGFIQWLIDYANKDK